jgi:hypothetical protein
MDYTFNNLNEKMKNTIDKQLSNESSNEHTIHPCIHKTFKSEYQKFQ